MSVLILRMSAAMRYCIPNQGLMKLMKRPLRRLKDGQDHAWPQEVMRRKDTTARQFFKEVVVKGS